MKIQIGLFGSRISGAPNVLASSAHAHLASVASTVVAVAVVAFGAALTPLAAFAQSSTIGSEPSERLERYDYTAPAMGTTFRLVFYARTDDQASHAASATFTRIAHLDSLFSDYRRDSEIARLADRAGESEATVVSPELWDVLLASGRWFDRTEGAFDVTLGPLTRLWRWSDRRGELPAQARLEAARRVSGFGHVSFDHERRAVLLELPGMSLDLGGIAKGFAADAALAVLADHGIESAMVDAGGDLAVGAAPPGADGWVVMLPSGEHRRLTHAAVATSGDEHRFVEIEGVRYAHIVDPNTGLGVVDAPTVTVVAKDGLTADVLASALTVLPAEEGRTLAETLQGVQVWIQPGTAGRPGSSPSERRR